MLCFTLYLAAVSLLAGTAAMNQAFNNSGELNIATCPITYYGQKYEKVYVTSDTKKIAVCFNGLFKSGTKNDCILISGGTADRGDLATFAKEIPTGSGVHKLLPNLKNVGKCVNIIHLRDSNQSKIIQVELGNFGTHAILAIKTFSGYTHADVVADAQVNGQPVHKQNFRTNETSVGVVIDVSGCRHSGVAYKMNTTSIDPNMCLNVNCDVSGVVEALSYCGPKEHCHSGGSCVSSATCTVIANAVITFTDRVHHVPDRCVYTLLNTSAAPGFRLMGLFKERHRKSISFLEQVILQLDNRRELITLEQGGRVRLNKELRVIPAVGAKIYGVKFSLDQTGVTAELPSHNISIFFDGNKAQIVKTGPSGALEGGLCSASTLTLTEQKVSKLSDTGCETRYIDKNDSRIDCNAGKQWCGLLKLTPFTACKMIVSPNPFVTACIETFCKYPQVDGLGCQFLEAYARACSHHDHVNLDGWRSKSKCSAAPLASCKDKICSAHEFCGEAANGRDTRCHCRAIFASKYRSTNSLGETPVCKKNAASITLAGCLLEDNYIDYSELHLNDKTCKGVMDNQTHMVTFSFDSGRPCGSVIMVHNDQIIYKNTITIRNISMDQTINRQGRVHIDLSCFYNQLDVKNLGLKIHQSSIIQNLKAQHWVYNLTMAAYTDPRYMQPIQLSEEIQLNQRIWVELKTEGLDQKMLATVVDSCWATSQPSANAGQRYDLIIKGCPYRADQTVKVEDNGPGMSNRFSFNMFQFTGSDDNVYLHCKVVLCVKKSQTCVPSCDHAVRKRRSVESTHAGGLITMVWS